MINFCYDTIINEVGYPNLAIFPAKPFTAEWRQFDAHWPRTVPLRLLMYLDLANIPYGTYTVKNAPKGSWYPIAFSWFDFTCDYFSMLPVDTKERLRKGDIKILFYYHEGDNPARIENHLRVSCRGSRLPENCYYFISANTAAEQLPNATYFSEHEFFFRYVNHKQTFIANPNKIYDFTALNRTHKWWRASVMSDLVRDNILTNSIWSYHTDCTIDNDPADNPIELDIVDPTWRSITEQFVANGPYKWDQLTLHEQNDHHIVNTDLYTKSYFHIIIETHFDADQSGGTFITEKTWKPIKFGQPFVVVGPAGTLETLRNAGYRVFDSVLDNSYDNIENNTKRWLAVKKLLKQIKNDGVANIADRCADDVKHNQQFFQGRTVEPLNILLEKLQCKN